MASTDSSQNNIYQKGPIKKNKPNPKHPEGNEIDAFWSKFEFSNAPCSDISTNIDKYLEGK